MPLYIHQWSSHPLLILKHIAKVISRRLTASHDESFFKDAPPIYHRGLAASGFKASIEYINKRKAPNCWPGQPYILGGKKGSARLSKPTSLRNSCALSMCTSLPVQNCTVAIRWHNLPGICAHRQWRGEGICWAAEQPFKARLANHNTSCRHKHYEESNKLLKHVWQVRRSSRVCSVIWEILQHVFPCNNKTKWCHPCISKELAILNASKETLLNKGSEFFSKCHHQNKFYLVNFARQ